MTTTPTLALLATGGTIAGVGELGNYTAGALPAEALFEAVPELRSLAAWRIEQPFSLDSSDITPAHWLQLAERIKSLLDDEAVQGVVITHGTDTLEETAYALSRLVSTGKPVVLTAAMRPATSLSADGPLNLLHAAQIALSTDGAGRGILVASNDRIISGARVVKAHTHAPDALSPQEGGLEGAIAGENVVFYHPPRRAQPAILSVPAQAAIPRVDIVSVSAGQNPDLIDWLVNQGAQGLVLALPGHGSIPVAFIPALKRARAKGVAIVRASRVAQGIVARNHNAEDDKHGWIAAGYRNPLQARVLLILGLAAGLSIDALAGQFYAEPF